MSADGIIMRFHIRCENDKITTSSIRSSIEKHLNKANPILIDVINNEWLIALKEFLKTNNYKETLDVKIAGDSLEVKWTNDDNDLRIGMATSASISTTPDGTDNQPDVTGTDDTRRVKNTSDKQLEMETWNRMGSISKEEGDGKRERVNSETMESIDVITDDKRSP